MEDYLKYIIIAFGILALFIKIPKIELPIWKWILSGLGNAINAPVMAEIKKLKDASDANDIEIKNRLESYSTETNLKFTELNSRLDTVNTKVDSVTEKLKQHITQAQFTKADETRQRIINFSDGIVENKVYSKEAWRKALKDCTDYLNFCREHEDYQNTEAEASIEMIKHGFQTASENNKFLY